MKSETETNSMGGGSNGMDAGWSAADTAATREELYRLLSEGRPVRRSGGDQVFPAWVAKITAWMEARLGGLVATGYEDESGFHYGPHPAREGFPGAAD